MPETPAERHQKLVEAGARRYLATYAATMAYLGQGGFTPGISPPSPDVLTQHFESTTPQYWQTLKEQAPKEARSQLRQWEKAQ